ncbi:hypothetical protein B0H11DRAFT_1911666 [Mycena galericulata]|nr:hypothetical protein B0H11DRAFT_1911666 [Mycena galericulata]
MRLADDCRVFIVFGESPSTRNFDKDRFHRESDSHIHSDPEIPPPDRFSSLSSMVPTKGSKNGKTASTAKPAKAPSARKRKPSAKAKAAEKAAKKAAKNNDVRHKP